MVLSGHEVAQQIKVLAANLEDLSSIPRTPLVKGENGLYKVVL